MRSSSPTRRLSWRLTWRLAAVACLAHVAAGAAAGDPAPALRAAAEEVDAYLEGWRAGRKVGVRVIDPLLSERIGRLRAEAPSFDAAWRELEAGDVPVVIGTRTQLVENLPRHVRASDGWAGITVTWADDAEPLSRAAVAIRVEWLRELHESYGNPESAFLEALDGLIIHEVYGHLTPAVHARGRAGLCADPARGERLADSCVGRRELALKAERRTRVARRSW